MVTPRPCIYLKTKVCDSPMSCPVVCQRNAVLEDVE